MYRRKVLVLTAIAAFAVTALGLLGSAGEGRATARMIDPFTLTAAPNPANFGRRVAFTIDFANASAQTLVHASFHGTATGAVAYLPDYSTTSRGTCQADPAGSLSVTCDYGNLESGAHVTTTFVFSLPLMGDETASVSFDATNGLTINEGGAGGCTPGQQCQFSPDPATISVPVRAESVNQVSDVFKPTGGGRTITTGLPTAATASSAAARANAKLPATTTYTNPTGMTMTIPSTGVTVAASILEGLDNTGVCGSGVTQPATVATEMTVPGDYSADPLAVVFYALDKALPNGVQGKSLKFCHNGSVVPPCPLTPPFPGADCQSGSPSKMKNEDGDFVWGIPVLLKSNGRGVGGYP
jgi:hypothetical protein